MSKVDLIRYDNEYMKGPEGFASDDANIESEFPAEIQAPPTPEVRPKKKKKPATVATSFDELSEVWPDLETPTEQTESTPLPTEEPVEKTAEPAEVPKTPEQTEKANADTERTYAIELARKNLDEIAESTETDQEPNNIPVLEAEMLAPMTFAETRAEEKRKKEKREAEKKSQEEIDLENTPGAKKIHDPQKEHELKKVGIRHRKDISDQDWQRYLDATVGRGKTRKEQEAALAYMVLKEEQEQKQAEEKAKAAEVEAVLKKKREQEETIRRQKAVYKESEARRAKIRADMEEMNARHDARKKEEATRSVKNRIDAKIDQINKRIQARKAQNEKRQTDEERRKEAQKLGEEGRKKFAALIEEHLPKPEFLKAKDISSARTLEELCSTISDSSGIRYKNTSRSGKERFLKMNPGEIISLIDEVIADHNGLDDIPKKHGLRERVAYLSAYEQTMKTKAFKVWFPKLKDASPEILKAIESGRMAALAKLGYKYPEKTPAAPEAPATTPETATATRVETSPAPADVSVDSLDFDSIPEAIYDTDAPISEEEIAPANGFWGKVGRGLKLTGKYSWKGLKAIGKGGLKLAKKTIAKINDDIWPAFKFDYKDSRENGWFFGDRKKK